MSEVTAPQPESEAEQTTSVLLGHCVLIYTEMDKLADNTPEGRVFTGSLVELFNATGLGQPYYTQVTRKLKSMDCIRQIQRGGGPKPSRWMMMQPPSEELFQLPDTYHEKLSTSAGARRMYEQQLRDLNTRVLKLEAWAKRQGYNPYSD